MTYREYVKRMSSEAWSTYLSDQSHFNRQVWLAIKRNDIEELKSILEDGKSSEYELWISSNEVPEWAQSLIREY